MLSLQIFTDGSVNTESKVGYGAFLLIQDINSSVESLKDKVRLKRFEQTSSTKLELQTFLWALEETIASGNGDKIVITAYTDSQNIIGLPGRRQRLEQNNYFSAKNKRLSNYELYQEFYQLTSQINCNFIKVSGHQPSGEKDKIAKIFSLVDRASRGALREDLCI